jgi:hypothetical protein
MIILMTVHRSSFPIYLAIKTVAQLEWETVLLIIFSWTCRLSSRSLSVLYAHAVNSYGELLDSIYLHQKYSRPMTYESWKEVQMLVDYVSLDLTSVWR